MGAGAFLRNLNTPIDFNPFLIDDQDQFKKTARTLTRRVERFGCVPVRRGPGLTHWVREAAHSCEAYFSLPEDTKMRNRAKTAGGEGYNAFPKETGGDRNGAELCEAFVVNRINPSVPDDDFFYARSVNRPEAPERFRYHLERLYDAIDELTEEILQAFSVGCGMKPAFFKSVTGRGALSARVCRSAGAGGVDQHDGEPASRRDVALLTVLPGGAAAAIEIWDRHEGEFFSVETPPDQALVMGGELLACITSGHLHAPTYRARLSPDRNVSSVSIAGYLIGNDKTKIRRMFPDADNFYTRLQPDIETMTPVEFVKTRLGLADRQREFAFSREA